MQIKRYSIALTEYKKNVAIIKTLITYNVQRTSYIIVKSLIVLFYRVYKYRKNKQLCKLKNLMFVIFMSKSWQKYIILLCIS